MAKRSAPGAGSGMSNRFGPIAKAFESSIARMHRVASRGPRFAKTVANPHCGSREPHPHAANVGWERVSVDPIKVGGILMKLNDKIAVITGAARGIGKAIAERYVKEGAKVVVADLNEQGAKAVASELGHNVVGLKLDVTDQASIDAMVADTVSKFGGVDILVNNAGLFDLAPIVEITRESYRRVYAVNVEGLLFTLQAVAKQMIKQGRRGKIINFASQAGRRGEPLVAIYCSSKAAVISLTQSAGLDLIKHRINVNGIAPGVVDNEHWNHVDAMFAKYENLKPGEKKRVVGASVPFGRMARPDEIGGLATFLASEDADYIVAQTYNIDGGNWMS
jgi:acetoin reductase-like protein